MTVLPFRYVFFNMFKQIPFSVCSKPVRSVFICFLYFFTFFEGVMTKTPSSLMFNSVMSLYYTWYSNLHSWNLNWCEQLWNSLFWLLYWATTLFHSVNSSFLNKIFFLISRLYIFMSDLFIIHFKKLSCLHLKKKSTLWSVNMGKGKKNVWIVLQTLGGKSKLFKNLTGLTSSIFFFPS